MYNFNILILSASKNIKYCLNETSRVTKPTSTTITEDVSLWFSFRADINRMLHPSVSSHTKILRFIKEKVSTIIFVKLCLSKKLIMIIFIMEWWSVRVTSLEEEILDSIKRTNESNQIVFPTFFSDMQLAKFCLKISFKIIVKCKLTMLVNTEQRFIVNHFTSDFSVTMSSFYLHF